MLGQTPGGSYRQQNKAKPSEASDVQPPRSPDLNPLHFHLWGDLKTHQRVQIPTVNKETPHKHIYMTIKPFAKALGRSERVRDSMTRRVHACFAQVDNILSLL
jgi:hypothetical protein